MRGGIQRKVVAGAKEASSGSPQGDDFGAVRGMGGDVAKADRKTLLIVEDDHAVRETFEVALGGLGPPLVSVADGRAAMAELHKGHVALVVLDLNLPHISGVRVLEWMSSFADGVPVVVVTGVPGAREVVARFPNLVRVILEKPFRLDLLRSTVASSLGLETQGDGGESSKDGAGAAPAPFEGKAPG